MLDFGFNRRDFLRIGGIGAGMSAIGLSDAALAEEEQSELVRLIQDVQVINPSKPSHSGLMS